MIQHNRNQNQGKGTAKRRQWRNVTAKNNVLLIVDNFDSLKEEMLVAIYIPNLKCVSLNLEKLCQETEKKIHLIFIVIQVLGQVHGIHLL